ALQTAHAFFGQMSIQRWPPAETKLAKLEQFFTHCRNIGGLGFKWFAECDRYRVGDSLRKFGEKSSALEREDRAPELVQPSRNNKGVGMPRDQFVTALQAQ